MYLGTAEGKVGNLPVPDHIKTSPIYPIAEKRMEDLKEFITSQKAEDPNIVVDPIDLKFGQRKRMAVEEPIEEPASKKEKFSTTGRSLVDQLKCEFSYAKFEEIFEKFDMVQLKSQDYTTDELDTPLL